jgi:circadian clock protein KaiC
MTTPAQSIIKTATGIIGLDEITFGGLPSGRPTLVIGNAGTGKTLMAMEFVLRGIERHAENGVFISFEESPEELIQNTFSLGFDLADYQLKNNLAIKHIDLKADSSTESGEYDLEALFIRFDAAIRSVNAKRVVIDAVENLFAAFSDTRTIRIEFQRLMRWLKERGVTAIITTERGTIALTHHGIEEYISDCVILLDNRVENQISIRRLRIVKYRGSAHGSNEYPFLMEKGGFKVMPVTSLGLAHSVSKNRVSSGINELDNMLGSQGFYEGSSILVSGMSGSGKSSLAAHFIDAACRRGDKCVYVALEESPEQIKRNMLSIGIDLNQWVDSGLLTFFASRPNSQGLESHFLQLYNIIREYKPRAVVIDPISAFSSSASLTDIKILLIRKSDLLKSHGITTMFINLTDNQDAYATDTAVSSLMDAWIFLRNLEASGERSRTLYVLKARGIAHSNQVREFIMTDSGVRLIDVALDDQGNILIGAARQFNLARINAGIQAQSDSVANRRALLENKRKIMEAKVLALRSEFEDEIHNLEAEIFNEEQRIRKDAADLAKIIHQRNSQKSDL